jgi:hypothetical protein
MISHQLKIIFIHIRKTGGNSLALFLKDYINDKILITESKLGKSDGIKIISELDNQSEIKHNYLEWYYKNYSPKICNMYVKIVIVRNPYDRMMSYYFYKSKQTTNSKIKFERKVYLKVLFALDTQIKYLQVDGLIPHNTKIIKFENMIDDLSKIENLKNLDWSSFPKIDRSKNSLFGTDSYLNFLTPELKKITYRKFKEDFETFGYDPNL